MIGSPTVTCRKPVSPKSKPARSVARYNANAASATSNAGTSARRVGLAPRSATGALAGDGGTDLGKRPRVDDVPRFDPAAAGGGDAEQHLPLQHFRAVAVAVDDQFCAGGDGAAGERAVEIEVRRRAVHFDEGCGLDGELEAPAGSEN